MELKRRASGAVNGGYWRLQGGRVVRFGGDNHVSGRATSFLRELMSPRGVLRYMCPTRLQGLRRPSPPRPPPLANPTRSYSTR